MRVGLRDRLVRHQQAASDQCPVLTGGRLTGSLQYALAPAQLGLHCGLPCPTLPCSETLPAGPRWKPPAPHRFAPKPCPTGPRWNAAALHLWLGAETLWASAPPFWRLTRTCARCCPTMASCTRGALVPAWLGLPNRQFEAVKGDPKPSPRCVLGGCATNPAHHHHARRSDLALVNPANHPEIALPLLLVPLI